MLLTSSDKNKELYLIFRNRHEDAALRDGGDIQDRR